MKYSFTLPEEINPEFMPLKLGIEKIAQLLSKNLAELQNLMACSYIVETGEIGISICQRFDDGIQKWYIQRIENRQTDDYLRRLQAANVLSEVLLKQKAEIWRTITPLRASEAVIVVNPVKGIWIQKKESSERIISVAI